MSSRHGMIASGWRQGRWFAVALLLALASALVPAIWPSGPPASRFAGSAFDPATSVVTLRGRAQPVMQADTRHDEASGSGPASHAPIAVPIPAPAIPRIAGASIAPHEPTGASVPSAFLRQLAHARPRAPPAAMT